LDGHASARELLLLLLEQPAIKPAATTNAAAVTPSRRPPIVLASLPMAHHSVFTSLDSSAITLARPARPAEGWNYPHPEDAESSFSRVPVQRVGP
jgi:hypothetical protein